MAASEAMQSAARAVSAENDRLRELLALRGVSQAEISTYLASPRHIASAAAPISSSVQRPTPMSGHHDASKHADYEARFAQAQAESRTSHTPKYRQSRASVTLLSTKPSESANTDRPVASAEKLETATVRKTRLYSVRNSSDQAESPSHCGEECHTALRQGRNETGDHCAHSGYNEVDHTILPPVSDCFCPEEISDVAAPPSLETSCDMAAEILIQFHKKGDSAEARTALGCVGSESCSVKNTTIFKLMDDLG